MVKILSQAGDSLADMYDVEGSIAGIEDLDTRELGIIHEMGQTIFSERFTMRLGRVTGTFLQNTGFDLSFTALPAAPTRILGCSVWTDVTGRLTHCNMSVHNPRAAAEREMPFWAWNTADDVESAARVIDEGTLANRILLRPLSPSPNLPVMIESSAQNDPARVNEIFFRGLTGGFGAGNVIIEAHVLIAFADIIGVSSRGLPIPSW